MAGCRSVGKSRVGQRDDVDGLAAGDRSAPGSRLRARSTVAPAVTSLSSSDLEVLDAAAAHRDVALGHHGADGERAGDDAVRHRLVQRCGQGCSPSTPSISSVERADARRAGRPSRSAARTGRRSPARGRRCRSPWCPWPAPRPSAGSRSLRRSGSPARSSRPAADPARAMRKPCSVSTVAPSFCRPLMCMSSPRLPIASPPGSATLASPRRATSGPEHRDAGPHPAHQVVVGLGADLRRHVDRDACRRDASAVARPAADVLDAAPQAAQHLAHDVDVEDVGHRRTASVRPSASSAAAISFSAEFFAP